LTVFHPSIALTNHEISRMVHGLNWLHILKKM